MNSSAAIEARRLLASNEAQLKSILDTAPDAMVVIDECGRICAFSASAERIFGYSAADAMGMDASFLMPKDEAEKARQHLESYMESGDKRMIAEGRRVLGLRSDGSRFAMHLCIGESKAGGRRLFTAFMHDLSEREASERRMRELQSELFRQSRIGIMSTMTTALAHEVNQPLAAITNYVQAVDLMLDMPPEDWDVSDIKMALRNAGAAAIRAGEIVSRLRRFVQRGELQRSLALPSEILDQTCSLASVEAKVRGLRCRVEIDDVEMPVLADQVQIQQVLINLARNAFEAIEDDPDTDEVVLSAAAGDAVMCFSVIDKGPGLPNGHVPFVPFSSTKRDGMGLGLSICKTIVEAHGGKIWHEPIEPRGTAFKFTLPFASKKDEA